MKLPIDSLADMKKSLLFRWCFIFLFSSGSLVYAKHGEPRVNLPVHGPLPPASKKASPPSVDGPYAIEWTDINNLTVNADNSLFKAGTGTSWNASAASHNLLEELSDGSIEFVLGDIGNHYMVGLSHTNVDVSYNTIRYALFIHSNGNVYIYESGASRGAFGTLTKGDVFRLSRENGQIKYYQNGQLLRTAPGTSEEALITDVSVYNGSVPPVTSSFGTLRIEAVGIQAQPGAGGGSVSTVAAGGTPPYTYSWSSGETTPSISDKPKGAYTLTVTDADGETRRGTYYLGYKTDWTDLVNVTVNADNSLTKSGAGNSSDAGAASYNMLEAGKDGWIQFAMGEELNPFIIGLSHINRDLAPIKVKYGIYIHNTAVSIFENGVNQGQVATARKGDVFRIVREGGTISYRQNGRVMRSISGVPAESLLVDFKINSGSAPVVTTSFGSLRIEGTVVVPGNNSSNGSITAMASGGLQPYTYAWSSGESTPGINGKAQGQYTLTVTDANGEARTRQFDLGYKVEWTDLIGMAINSDNTLSKTAALGWSSGAASYNRLEPNKNGWTEFVMGDVGNVYMVALSHLNPDISVNGVKYGLYVTATGALAIYESGTHKGLVGYARKGDVLSINREGEEIRYYQNGSILRSVTVSPSESLQIDAALYSGTIPEVTSSFGVLRLEASVTPPGSGASNGSIAVTAVGGASPYTYSWTSGENTSSVTGKTPGSYGITVTDAEGVANSRVYGLGHPTNWANALAVTVNPDNSLIRNTSGGGWDCGAVSYNKLRAGDGWMEFLVSDIGTGNYMAGLTSTYAVTTFHTIQYAIYITTAGPLYIYESGTNRGQLAFARKGDVCRVAREGASIKYYLNGTLLRTIAADPNLELWTKTSMSTGRTPVITSSFDSQELQMQASVTGSGYTNGTGNISLTVSGGTTPYTYTWSSGETTSTITDKTRGSYTVTVTDAGGLSLTRVYAVGYKVNYVNHTQVTETAGVLTKSGWAGWNGGANSTNALAPNTNGWIEFVAGNVSGYAIGFSQNLGGYNPGDFKNALVLNNASQFYSYEGSTSTALGTYNRGDVFRIAREGSTVKYYQNGNVLRTVTTDPALEIFVKASLNGGSTPLITTSFDSQLKVLATVRGTGNADGSGSISLNIIGGAAPYTYQWSSGEQTSTISNKQRGSYTITVTDAEGRTQARTFNLGYKLHHMDLFQVTDTDGVLTKTLAPGWNAAANASNVLPGNTDGWMEFVTESIGAYAIGFQYSINGISYTDYRNGLVLNAAGIVSIYETATGYTTVGNWVPGDIFRITREGSSIKYYRNGTVIRTSATDAKLDLLVKVALHAGSTPLVTTSFDTQLMVRAVVKSTDRADGTGSISLDAAGGIGPYTYAWAGGEQTNTIENKTRGVYTATVTDAEGRSRSQTYQIGYKLQHADLYQATDTEGILTKTQPVGWNSGSNSFNVLPANTDGWIEFVTGKNVDAYHVAFGNNTSTYTYNDSKNGVVIGTVNQVIIYEGGSAYPSGAWVPGDVFRIAREGSSITYYRNGAVLRTVTTDPKLELWLKTLLYLGSTPEIATSFDTRPRVEAVVKGTGNSDGTGNISVNVTGAAAPYIYTWSSGEQTDSVGNKSRGSYTFTVTDGEGRSRNRTYNVGYKLNYTGHTLVTETDGVLTKAGAAGWNAGANSSNVLPANTDGWVEFVASAGSTYEVGFGTNVNQFSYSDVRASFALFHTTSLAYSYEGLTGNIVSSWESGDVFRIAREGTSIKYYKNGELLRTITTDPKLELWIKTLVNTGKAPRVTASFDSRLILKAVVRNTGVADGTGSIALDVTGGAAPYTYTWAGGDQTDSIGNKPRGAYMVTVTDAEGRTLTRTYSIGYKLHYTDHYQVTETNGVLSKTGTSGWNAGANSTNVLPANTDGWLEFVANSGVTYEIGFGYNFHLTGGFSYSDFRNGIALYHSTGLVYYYEQTNGATIASWLPGDIFRLAREGATIKYYQNGVLLRTMPTDPKVELVVKASVNTTGSTPLVAVSFDDQMNIMAQVSGLSNAAGTGGIELTTAGGTAPLQYTWSTGEQGTSLTNKPQGAYTVTVTDAENRTQNRTYGIGYNAYWTDLLGVSESDHILTKTAAVGWGNAGANSANVLPGNTDGWIQFVATLASNYVYEIGFATDMANFSYSSFTNGLRLDQALLLAYSYEGTNATILGSWRPGDVMRIAREGNQVRYYRNDVVLRTVTVNATLELRAKAVLNTGKTPRVSTSFTVAPGQGQTPDAAEFLTLKQLYDSLGGSGWMNKTNWPTTWPASANNAQYGTWYGVTVQDGDIVSLSLPNNNLVGKIPTGVGKLTELTQLSLYGNTITGKIPHQVGNLTHLTKLLLNNNQLAGSIPATLGNLTDLQELMLEGNLLTGSIPASVGNLTKLIHFQLSNNRLAGPIPASLGNLKELETLGLQTNLLTGAIPAELGTLNKLRVLTLGDNQLTGSIPAEIGNLSSLQTLNLEMNQLTGQLPATLGNLTGLTALRLGTNQLSGAVPSSLGNLISLTILQLDHNQLSGTIPATLGNLTQVSRLFLNDNQFTGSIPVEFGNLSSVQYLYLSNNALNGTIPSQLSTLMNLTDLGLDHNQLLGSIPEALGNLPGIRSLHAGFNQLSGTVPATFSNAPNLVYLNLQNNELTSFGNFTGAVNKGNLNIEVQENRISFDNIEANMTGVSQHGYQRFVFAPQKPFNEITQLSVTKGAVLKIQARSAGSRGAITWEWQPEGSSTWTNVTSQNEDNTQQTLQLSNFQPASAGLYRYKMTNTWAPGVVLESVAIKVKLGDYLVQWIDLAGVSQSNGALTTATPGNWFMGANSSNLLPAGLNGSVSFIIANTTSRYMIGFTTYRGGFDTPYIDYGLAVEPGLPLSAWENGSAGAALTSWQVGDTLRITRDGNQIRYYQNGTEIRSATTVAAKELRIKGLVYQGSTPVVRASFDVQLALQAAITPVNVGGSNGSIAVSAVHGTAPYTYSWLSGETTASVTNKSLGTYRVTATDAAGRAITIPYSLGHKVVWNNHTGVSENNGTLTKGSTTQNWDAGANSFNLLKAGQDGWIELIVNNSTSTYIIGFSGDGSSFTTTGVEYGLLVQPGQLLSAWESSATGVDIGNWQVGDALKIARIGNQVKYYRNGVELRTVTTDPQRELRIKSTINSGSSPSALASFDVQLLLTATITPVKSYGLAGGISVVTTGGKAPYAYNWSGGETTAAIANKNVGTYTVTARDADGRVMNIPYDLGYRVLWTDLNGVSGSNSLTRTSGEGWDVGANSLNTLKANQDGWIEFIPESNASNIMVGLAVYSGGIFNTAAVGYGLSIQPGKKVSAWESAWNGIDLGTHWQTGDVFKIARTGDQIRYYRNGVELRSVTTDPTKELRIKALIYKGTLGLVQASVPSKQYDIMALDDSTAVYTIPKAVKVSREGLSPLPPVERQFTLREITEGETKELFQAPPCLVGQYYAGFQLYYDLGDKNTSENWSSYVQVTLFHGEDSLWTKPIRVRMKDQTFIATAFYDEPISCDGNYYFHIDYKELEGAVPQDNVYLKVLLYKVRTAAFNPASSMSVSCSYDSVAHETSLYWNYTGQSAIEYDIEWVFIDQYDQLAGDPFNFREPVRITTSNASTYKHQVYYPTGRLWYRVRAVGFDPRYPNHRIPGQWFSGTCGAIDVKNHQPELNWQEQTVFAEEGKYKKLMNYFDGTMRQRQMQTSLSTGNVTVVGETYYDYEGRASVDVLAVPATDGSLNYRPAFNAFQATDSRITNNTSDSRHKFHYDNRKLENSPLSDQRGAGQYYSANNASNGIHRDYIPEGNGYAYSQKEFLNDKTERVVRQSTVGEQFRIDGTHAIRYSYGSAAPEELVRLFGTNVGVADHYKKNLVVDPNGQVSVSYLDQKDRIIATALAGDSPSSVESLQSYKDLGDPSLTVDLSRKNTKKEGVSHTSHKILNTVPNTSYAFQYDLTAYSSLIAGFGCKTCSFDLKITIADPDGSMLDLSLAPGNQSTDKYAYARDAIRTEEICTNPTVSHVLFDVQFKDIGDYTVTKTLVPHEMTYAEMDTLMRLNESVQTKINELKNVYAVDSTDCEICTTCPEAEEAIDEAINEIADLDCENLYLQIEQYWQDLYAKRYRDSHDGEESEDIFEIPLDSIQAHPLHCQYALCSTNKASDVFEKQVARAANWAAAVTEGYTDLVDDDPFFNDAALTGYNYKSNMVSVLNSIELITLRGVTYSGTLDEVTNPDNTEYYINAQGDHDVNGKHILYLDVMGRRSQMTEAKYQAELGRQRWALYRSFYSEAKRKLKLTIPEYANCAAAKEELERIDELPETEDEIIEWGEQNQATVPVTQEDLETTLASLKVSCGKKFSAADSIAMGQHLQAYFNSNPKNFFRLVLKHDLGNNASLNAIRSILQTKYGCAALDSIALEDPLTCAKDTTIVIEEPEPEEPREDVRVASAEASALDASAPPAMPTLEMMAATEETSGDGSVSARMATSSFGILAVPDSLPRQEEYDALLALYNATGGTSHWYRRSGWQAAAEDPNKATRHVYNWTGVTVDYTTGHILRLDLPMNQLNGYIPEEINNLKWLTHLDLGCQNGCYENQADRSNRITGIPDSFHGLTNLRFLDLFGQRNMNGGRLFSLGKMWKILYPCAQLRYLDLGNCNLKGPFTDSITHFVDLRQLIMASNPSINDTIPEGLGYLQNLQRLNLSYCGLQYPKTDTLWTILPLRHLNLSNNNLKDSIPHAVGNLVNLTTLVLSGNPFNDTIPIEIGKLRGLDTLFIGNAKVKNPLPDTLWSLNELRALELSSNLLKDSIPHALGRLINLEYLSMGRNAFKDTIPSTIAYLTKLQVLDMNADSLRKPIPKGLWNIKTLRQLQLSYNPRINDDLPGSVGKLTNLEILYMAGDSLSGPIPDSIGYLTKLRYLDLNGNKLDSIPPSIGNLRSIDFMYLSYNRFRYIPRTIGNLSTIRQLHLNNNKIVGELPASIGKLRNLIYFYANNNKISGSIPDSLRYATTIATLNLSNNKLTGQVPAGLWSHSYYYFSSPSINLDNNMLSGYISPEGVTFYPPQAALQNNKFTFSDLIALKRKYAEFNQSLLNYSPQDTVDVPKIHNVKLGRTLVLTTSIDRNTDTPCTYQWFRSTNGGYTGTPVAGNESTDGHTVSITVTEADEGALFYYKIRNQQELPNLTLYSHLQKLNVVMPETRTYCLEYDQNNPTLKLFRYDVDWNEQIQKCLALAANEQEYLIKYATDKIVEEEVSTFYNTYRTNCFNNANEKLKYTYLNREYHYTLYYYDQAENLVQTVPPKGVVPLSPGELDQSMSGNVIDPRHKLVTRYKYNSLNQIVSQKTPDAGRSQFWYNEKGQLKLAQNAQQEKENNYSYVKYDEQSRLTEAGEMNTTRPLTELLTHLDSMAFPREQEYVLTDITRTHFDFADPNVIDSFPQHNVRGKVSYTEILAKNTSDTVRTYYSYDIHGNVRSLLQKVPGISPKRTDYVYDRVSGKVNYVMYEYDRKDEFIHHYVYDADTRIVEVETSSDGFIWDRDASYAYYLHGTLARSELGEHRVQGIDYLYTLRGWLKGVNGLVDPGRDGATGSVVPKDEYSFTLGYHEDDYAGIGIGSATGSYQLPAARYTEWTGNAGLYNGNIAWMSTSLKKIGEVKGDWRKSTQAMLYRYDQLNRLLQTRSLTQFNGAQGFASRTESPAAYDEDYSYDANGNFLTLQRRNEQAALQDNFSYSYYTGTNRLRQLIPVERDTVYAGGAVTSNQKVYRRITIQGNAHVESGTDVLLKATENIDVAPDFDVADDADFRAYVLPEEEGMYLYDAIGNLLWDQDKGVRLSWTPSGKLREIVRGDTTKITFRYDAAGNRIEKTVIKADTAYVTRYLYDATGNLLAVYLGEELHEQPIYGTDRFGTYRPGRRAGHRVLGARTYELNNHLSTVLVTVTDNIHLNADSAWANVISAHDYYPFGLEMAGRSYEDESYRYGFNGMEKDNEIYGDGGAYMTEFREYDPRTGRWFSVDPKQNEIPWQSPYVAMDNKPIIRNDVDGDCPTCVTGAIISGILELTFQMGEHMMSGDGFKTAFAKVDWVDVGISTAGGAVTGIFSGGIGKLASVVADPKKRKILQFVLEQGLDYLIGMAEEELGATIDKGALYAKLKAATGIELGAAKGNQLAAAATAWTPNEIGAKGEKITKQELKKLYPDAEILEQVEGEFLEKNGGSTFFDFVVVQDGEVIETVEAKTNSGRLTDQQKKYRDGKTVKLKGKDAEKAGIAGMKINKNKVANTLSKVKVNKNTLRKIGQVFKSL
jgi:RHS repeat-associated protein